MKKSLIAAAILASSAFATMANAADGTINFTGTISSTTCKIASGSEALTVDLGTVSTSSFGAAGSVASPSKLAIVVTECPAAVNASISFSGAGDANNSSLLALTKGTGNDAEATGVAIGFFEADGNTPIALNSASADKDLVATVDNTFDFVAKYVATASTVTAGKGNAAAEFTVRYN
ncbi:fimbrial protein [Pseudomonas alkylphenolica]|uniref:Fimbrial protein n=1 Tax=Pseudomonas alkylphenolica TaxID=237609 RepID=A0A443ZEW9_9PSED|nr:fimbrial protein [Pseudomonas alkylphenolica]RWU17230.1 fimbrial protein [Pseudomonas alkylphenolica]